MAKRVRGSVRPGQRRAIDRRPAPAASATPASGSGTGSAPRSAGLTEAEEARAAELEQQVLAQERQAQEARSRTRDRASRESYAAGTLAVRAEAEYAYVARDLRDIGRMAILMLVVLLICWVLVDVAKVVKIT